MSANKNVQLTKLGWQKLDVTSSVRQWYADGARSRLRLLIDCSGCGNLVKIHLFDESSSKPPANSDSGNQICYSVFLMWKRWTFVACGAKLVTFTARVQTAVIWLGFFSSFCNLVFPFGSEQSIHHHHHHHQRHMQMKKAIHIDHFL